MAFTKKPVCKFEMAMTTVNAVFAAMVSMFLGFWNLADGIKVFAGIWPMIAGLQDPVLICRPLVIGWFVVRQKLMKLLLDVIDAT